MVLESDKIEKEGHLEFLDDNLVEQNINSEYIKEIQEKMAEIEDGTNHNVVEKPGRNTNNRALADKPHKNSKGRHWILTWNNYTGTDIVFLEDWCKSNCENYTFQKEIGKEGTPHLQIYFSFKNPRSFKALKETFTGAHIEPCRNKIAAEQYCRKKETRDGNEIYQGKCRNKSEFKINVIDPLFGKKLYPYQEMIIDDIISKPIDERKIYWFYDNIGNKGKSTLIKHLMLNYGEVSIFLNGKPADMKHAVAEHCQSANLENVFIDIPREFFDKIAYGAIEELKNGMIFSGKYESKAVLFNTPRIIVMSNYLPIISKLSKDRWCIFEIEDNGEYKKIEINDDRLNF